MRPPRLFLGAAAVFGGVLSAVSCQRESVHQVTLVLAAPDGGTLSGFNCIEDEVTLIRPCIEGCYRRCTDACRDDVAKAREAGAAAAAVLAENLTCTHSCFSEESACSDQCTFTSTSATGTPLWARANGQPVCVVIDFLRVGSEIECRSSLKLLQPCLSQPDQCAVLQRRIHCVAPLADVPVDGGMEAATPIVGSNFAALHDAVRTNLEEVARTAPDEVVFVRILATTQDAGSLAADVRAIDLERVVGCSFSCPVLLSTRGTVTLELDEGRLGYCRASAARACAAMGTPALGATLEDLGF